MVVRLLIIGKSGCGKSSTGNTILGRERLDRDTTFAQTTRCGTHGGVAVEITEISCLDDTDWTPEKEATNVAQTVARMHPGPSVILYVVSISSRYTDEDRGFYERLKALLDPHMSKYIIVVFTRGDDLLRNNKTIHEALAKAPEHLRKVLEECDHRYVVFDNTADDKQPQVDRLLEEVRKLSKANGNKPFTCPLNSDVSEEEIEKKLRKVGEEEVKKTKYVKELEERTRIAQEKMLREQEDFEKKRLEHTIKDLDDRVTHIEGLLPSIINGVKSIIKAQEKTEKEIEQINIRLQAETTRWRCIIL